MNRQSRAVQKYWRRLAQQCVSLLQRARDQETRIILLEIATMYARVGESIDATQRPVTAPVLPIELIQNLGLDRAY